MLYLLLILVVIFLLANIVGKLINEFFKLNLNFNVHVGYLSLLAICQLVAIPMIIWEISSSTFQIVYSISIGLLVIFLLLVISKLKRMQIKELFCFYNKDSLKLNLITLILFSLVAFIVYLFIMSDYRADRMSDSSFYISMILENVQTDAIYTIDPWSGLVQGFSNLYRFVSYELFHSSIIGIFKVSPMLYINHGMVLINIFMIIISLFELSIKLFSNIRFSYLVFLGWIFTIFIFISGIEDGFFFFFSTDMIQRLPYSGKVLTYLCIIPLFFVLTQQLLNNLKNKSLLLGIIILNIAATSLTATSLFVFGIFYFAIIIVLIYKSYDTRLILGYCLTTAPLLFHIALIQFQILLIPLATIYLILIVLYFSKIKLGWLMKILKVLLYSVVIIIPILSLGVNVLTFMGKMDSITIIQFFKKFLITINSKTLTIWFIAILGCYNVLKSDKFEESIRYIYGYAPIIILIVFINPINSAFVSKYVTTIFVYQRLFYILPLFPLMGYGIKFILDKYITIEERNNVIYFCSLFIIALSYKPFDYVSGEVYERIINSNFNYEYMLNNLTVETNLFFKKLAKPVRVAHYFTDNYWGGELRAVREVAPNVILPYNTYIHRNLTETQQFNSESYKQYQLHLLMNGTIWLYDPFIDFNGNETEQTNYEFAIQYLSENYDYIVLSTENRIFGELIEGFGASMVYQNNRDSIYELKNLRYQ